MLTPPFGNVPSLYPVYAFEGKFGLIIHMLHIFDDVIQHEFILLPNQ